jgi:predicted nucleic acid-binding Zn ribbon protein
MRSARRHSPRPLAGALDAVVERAAPRTTLARVQGAWESVAGPVVAAESTPESERSGVVTVRCSSAVWAQELELLSGELLTSLKARLGTDAVRELRFVTGTRRA